MTCSYKDMAPEIVIPGDRKEDWEKLLDVIVNDGFTGICSISDLEQYQKQPKNWPEHKNIPEYCLHLGSFTSERDGPVDLYHYRDWQNPGHYSTGIVFGNEVHEYMSGWIGIRFSAGGAYEELWMREYECGLLKDEWIAEEARIGLETIARQRQIARTQELREKRNQTNATGNREARTKETSSESSA